MAWQTIDRRNTPTDEGPGLDDALRDKIRAFFPRYETRQAAMLPALHVIQDALGYCSVRAMRELAELLEVPASKVFDVVTFYTMFWTHPKGRKTIMLCRSIACQEMGAEKLKAAIQQRLGIGDHATTDDGEWSFMTEECLAACEHAPCMLINEKMHKCVKPEDLDALLSDPQNDKLDVPRSDLYDAPAGSRRASSPHGNGHS